MKAIVRHCEEFASSSGRGFRSAAFVVPTVRLLGGRQLGSTPNAARIDRRISSRRRAIRDGKVVRSSCTSCPPDRISAADRRRGFGVTVERRAPTVRWLSDADRRAPTQPASIRADLAARSSRPAARRTAATSSRQWLAPRRSSRAARRHPNQWIRRTTSQSSSSRTARRNPTHRVT
jgi:hypothetical protein